MERIDGHLLYRYYPEYVVFRESFSGDGSTTTFTLDGTIGNATLRGISWDLDCVKTAYPSHVTNTSKKPIYDSLIPLTRHRIGVSSINANTGVVTLDYAPRNGVDFYIWYWYALPTHGLLEDYYREDFVAHMEEEAVSYGVDITVDVTNFAGIFTSADNTVQKALDTADDHTHDGRYYTETETDTWRASVTVTEMGYLHGLTSDLQTQLDARCLESVFGTAIGTGLVLDSTTLKASTVLQKYHAIDPSADVQSLLGCADEAAIRTLLDLEAGTDFYSKSAEDTWRSSVTQTEMGYLNGITSDIQTQLDARCLESVFGASIGTGLLLDGTVLKTSAVLQTYHGIDPSASVQAVLGAATDAAILALLSGDAGAAFDWNAQNLTGLGTLSSAAGTLTIDQTNSLSDFELDSHLHDGETLQADGINSDGGAFPFTVTGDIGITGGNVGIGTASPSSKCHVHEATDTSLVCTFTAAYARDSYFHWASNTGGAQKDTYMGIDASNGNFFAGPSATSMVVDSSGKVGIGTASPAAQLHIDQSSATAAIPVLALDQGDTDDAFINFIGTSGAAVGNSICTTEQNNFQAMLRIEINGTGYWLKAYHTAG